MKFRPSNNPKVLDLIKSVRDRHHCLDSIGPIVLEELNVRGKPKRLCAWCTTEELFHGNRKYCSEDCSISAEASFYPQKEEGLRFLLIRQEWKCVGCQFDYSLVLKNIIEIEIKRYPAAAFTRDRPLEDLPWYYFKRLKNQSPKESKPEVDHIICISKGGESIGLDNHQVLCYSCHKAKTKKDLSGKRSK